MGNFEQPLPQSFDGSTSLTDNVIKTLTFKNAAGEATVLAKRVGIKVIINKTSGYTGVVHYKMFSERNDVAPADNVTSSNTSMWMGESVLDIPKYVSRIQFLSIDPSGIGVDISVIASSDADISGSTFN